MNFRRMMLVLGTVGLVVAGLAFLVTAAPTAASNGTGVNDASTAKLAPPQQNPTLRPQMTAVFGDIPPIDIGALNSDNTATPTPAASEGEVNPVLDFTYDECDPLEDDYIRVECINGQLNFTRKETAGTRYLYYRPVFTDAVIELTTRLPNASKNARYGVIFRMDETGENYYLLGVTNEGQYGLFRYATDHYETIIPYTDSFSVGNASFPSKIRIVNQGDTIAFDIGGQWLDSIRDPNLTSGQVALFVEPDEPNQTVIFDDFKVSEILSPLPVPSPRVPEPVATEESGVPIFGADESPTPEAQPQATQTPFFIVVTATPPPATQTPFVIVVTATPQPATAVPTRAPTRRPTEASSGCQAPGNEVFFYISNNYTGTVMRFTIGGGEWGTHDYDVQGDGQYYLIRMPPGKYTYTAFIPGKGKANGERTQYEGGQCYSLQFSP